MDILNKIQVINSFKVPSESWYYDTSQTYLHTAVCPTNSLSFLRYTFLNNSKIGAKFVQHAKDDKLPFYVYTHTRACARAHTHTHTYIYVYMYVYIYIYHVFSFNILGEEMKW
jgi:hypothetical protein